MAFLIKAFLPLIAIGSVIAAISYSFAAKPDIFWSEQPSQAKKFIFTVGSTQHYNGNECVFLNGSYVWQGDSEYPTPGSACEGTWEPLDGMKKHLKKFFQFSDLKPGDHGEDTIRLRVSGDDACGQMMIKNVKESGNTCNEPETKETDDKDCFGKEPGAQERNGELRDTLRFSLWLDQGASPGFQGTTDVGEGDNEFNQGDMMIFRDATIQRCLSVQEIRRHLRQARLAAFDVCRLADADGDGRPSDRSNRCLGLARDGRMLKDVTYYYGFSWSLPKETENETQTDSLQFDLEFFLKSNGQCSICTQQCGKKECEDTCRD